MYDYLRWYQEQDEVVDLMNNAKFIEVCWRYLLIPVDNKVNVIYFDRIGKAGQYLLLSWGYIEKIIDWILQDAVDAINHWIDYWYYIYTFRK